MYKEKREDDYKIERYIKFIYDGEYANSGFVAAICEAYSANENYDGETYSWDLNHYGFAEDLVQILIDYQENIEEFYKATHKRWRKKVSNILTEIFLENNEEKNDN